MRAHPSQNISPPSIKNQLLRRISHSSGVLSHPLTPLAKRLRSFGIGCIRALLDAHAVIGPETTIGVMKWLLSSQWSLLRPVTLSVNIIRVEKDLEVAKNTKSFQGHDQAWQNVHSESYRGVDGHPIRNHVGVSSYEGIEAEVGYLEAEGDLEVSLRLGVLWNWLVEPGAAGATPSEGAHNDHKVDKTKEIMVLMLITERTRAVTRISPYTSMTNCANQV